MIGSHMWQTILEIALHGRAEVTPAGGASVVYTNPGLACQETQLSSIRQRREDYGDPVLFERSFPR